MPKNENLRFGELIPCVSVIGTLTDENQNEFEIVVRGPEERVRRFVETAPLDIEIQPAEELPGRVEGTVQRKEKSPGPTEEKRARSLAVEVRVIKLQTKPPCVLHFTVEPFLLAGESDFYYFNDNWHAYVECESREGNADLYLREYGQAGAWEFRDSSTWTTPQDTVSAYKMYFGAWEVEVKAVGDVNAVYELTGDLSVPF
jgi:hypothetical protein